MKGNKKEKGASRGGEAVKVGDKRKGGIGGEGE